MTPPIRSAHELPNRLHELSTEMLTISPAMSYFGGFNPAMAEHAEQLAGAAAIADGWADGIESELQSLKGE